MPKIGGMLFGDHEGENQTYLFHVVKAWPWSSVNVQVLSSPPYILCYMPKIGGMLVGDHEGENQTYLFHGGHCSNMCSFIPISRGCSIDHRAA